MMKIAVCISSRRRPEGLRTLLDSLNRIFVPDGIEVSIIVVENDDQNYLEQLVNEFKEKTAFNLKYALETNQGLAYARNRSIKEADGADFCCFVDDDQTVANDWLSELVRCQKEFDADGVWGTNPPVFKKRVPQYVQEFHNPGNSKYGTIVRKAFTNSLMLRKKVLDQMEGPFDTRLNFSGGEDTYLTLLFSKNGGIIRSNPYAVAYEIVPEVRTTLKYILGRTYRISNTELMVRSLTEETFSASKTLPRLTMRFCYGLLISIPCLIKGGDDKLKGVLKMTNAVGGFLFIAGRQNQFYR
jgi:glycosyltransferase involved in cell wall biosynthesis